MVLDCVEFYGVLKDTAGDGWDGNENLYVGNHSMTLKDGFQDTVTICLSPGTYSPYVCDGDNAYWTEISWSIYDSDSVMVLSGASLNTENGKCNATWGNFTVDAKDVTDSVRNSTPLLCFPLLFRLITHTDLVWFLCEHATAVGHAVRVSTTEP